VTVSGNVGQVECWSAGVCGAWGKTMWQQSLVAGGLDPEEAE